MKVVNWFRDNFFYFIILFLIIFVFRQWFIHSEIIGGDWPYFFQDTIFSFPIIPPSWSLIHGNGLGGTILSYSIDSYLFSSAWVLHHLLNLSWLITYKIAWYGLFIILSFFSSLYLLKILFPNISKTFKWVAPLIFTTNTFILMIVAGGQIGEALALSITPFILGFFISCLQQKKIFSLSLLFLTLFFGFEMILDIRIAYIIVISSFFYWLLSIWNDRSKCYIFSSLPKILIPLFFAIGINAFWLFPVFFTHDTSFQSLGSAYTSTEAVKFFSFAKLENSIAFLHPNWPENIFGKVSFLNPAFLVLPILAFSSLLFINRKDKKNNFFLSIIFLNLVGLLGVFLAKGANDPFGNIYIWLFEKFPGFQFFRDPIKFYILISISYSMLIPFTLHAIYKKTLGMVWKQFDWIIYFLLTVFIIFWCFLIHQAIFGQLAGTFSNRSVPTDYVTLKNYFSSQPEFFRILWFPRQSRFANTTYFHPAVEAEPLFNSLTLQKTEAKFLSEKTENLLSDLSIKYVVVPYDPFGEIFVKDRKYDKNDYNKTIEFLKNIPWLKQVNGFGNVAVFEISNPRDHFWLQGEGSITYSSINSTMYSVQIITSKPISLIFSESYSPYWVAVVNGEKVSSTRTSDGLNSFQSSLFTGKQNITIYFTKSVYYSYGLWLSLCSMGTLIIIFVIGKVKKI